MTNFLNRFYFLSKLTTSLILLIFLTLLSYLFIKTYLEKNSPDTSNIEIGVLSNQINRLENIVKKNSSNLYDVKSLVQDNQQSVKNIGISLKTLNDKKINNNLSLQIDKLFKENNKLKDEVYNFSSKINNLENFQPSALQVTGSLAPVNNIVKLIKLKLDNGSSFTEEVELLKNLELSIEYSSHVEKLSIYATDHFPGLERLSDNFDNISSYYLHNYYLKKNKNYFIKYLINLVSIQPNLSENVEDETVLLLSLAKKNILNKNLDESIKKLSLLNDSEYFFSTWIKQATYYNQVTNLLNKL